jgi:serine-type D-Ala-D-Ala carboxypeptidase/endopeptidase (penicillin-binding protein 4)
MIRFYAAILLFTITVFPQNDVKQRINSYLGKLPQSTRMSVVVYNPMDQDTLFSINHLTPMIPASNTKLFTTAVALSVMGGNFQLATRLLTDDNNLADGIINGNIYIK